jgi:hypothetical protein
MCMKVSEGKNYVKRVSRDWKSVDKTDTQITAELMLLDVLSVQRVPLVALVIIVSFCLKI